MANLVIVTARCYLICNAINYISINECSDDDESFHKLSAKIKNKKKPSKESVDDVRLYKVNIHFELANSGNNTNSNRHSDTSSAVEIQVRGRKLVEELFGSIVQQIREQLPDQKFLDQLVENFLSSIDKDEK
jgi:hypothetical protein